MGVIPAEGTAARGGTGSLQRILGVPLVLWAANNLRRVIDRERIVIVTASPDVADVARRAGLGFAAPDEDMDPDRALVHDPLRCFCTPDTIRAAIEEGAHELATMRAGPIEQIRVDSPANLELARAVAAGLPPDHPCIAGVRGLRLRLTRRELAGEGRIDAVITDVDGVLTEGFLALASDGAETRAFHMHDGMGVRMLMKAGVKVGWISASLDTGPVRRRAERLGVPHIDIAEGDKGERFLRMCSEMGVEPAATLYIGDDVNDLPAMRFAGFTCCPADARPEVRGFVGLVLESPGGRGAFREAADMVLDA